MCNLQSLLWQARQWPLDEDLPSEHILHALPQFLRISAGMTIHEGSSWANRQAVTKAIVAQMMLRELNKTSMVFVLPRNGASVLVLRNDRTRESHLASFRCKHALTGPNPTLVRDNY